MERSTIFKGQIHYKRQCSIAMLNYQRVTTICLLEMMSSSKRCLGNVLLKIPEVLDLPTEKDVLLGPSNCSLKKKEKFHHPWSQTIVFYWFWHFDMDGLNFPPMSVTNRRRTRRHHSSTSPAGRPRQPRCDGRGVLGRQRAEVAAAGPGKG